MILLNLFLKQLKVELPRNWNLLLFYHLKIKIESITK
ncbi:unnamed protein product [Schistosoma margrebowiei]|uniref:Uncharacterized protein n=1 Tax=Schistosoma margrebowiei TaxID=48269 RepID=A0A3P8BJU1_9TREM|nr:unnamed protein product [Schistosoma margrebowiei]